MSVIENFFETNTYKQIEIFLKSKYHEEYSNFTQADIADKFEDVFLKGIREIQRLDEMKCPHHLLWINDKIPRRDKLDRVGNILWELKSKYTSFPIVPKQKLNEAVRRVISSGDPRYLDDYHDFILSYSFTNRDFNTIDMTHLVSLFPSDRIVRMNL